MSPLWYHFAGVSFLAAGMAYWFGIGLGINGGTVSLTNVSCTVLGLRLRFVASVIGPTVKDGRRASSALHCAQS